MSDLIETGGSALPPDHGPFPLARPLEDGPGLDLRRLWRALRSRLWLVVFTVVCVISPTMVFTLLAPKSYLSTVTVQIAPETVNLLPYKDVSESALSATFNYELYMKTQDDALRSPTLAERAILQVAKTDARAELFELRKRFFADLAVRRIEGSQLVKISYVSPDPEFSALVANTLAEEFIKQQFERKVETTEKARQFLETKLTDLRRRLEEAEAELIRYARLHQILNVDNKEENVIRQRFGFLTGELSRRESAYISKKAALEGFKEVSPEHFPESLKNPLITSLETRLVQAEQDLTQLRAQFGENWPDVIRKKQELELTRRQLEDEQRAAISAAVKQAEVELNTARDELALVTQAFRSQEELISGLNEASLQYNALKREVDTNEELYQSLLQRLKETGVTAGLEFTNIRITDRATPNPVPYRPRIIWNLMLALGVGLSLGIGLSFLLHTLDSTLRTPEDMEELGLPTLAWIPMIENGPKEAAKLVEGKRPGGQTALPAVFSERLDSSNGHTWINRTNWRARESFRALCASILLSRGDRPAQTILVTSALPQEGKTSTVAYMGVTMAQSGARTLLIEGDFRKPTLSSHFGIAEKKGLSLLLSGGDCPIRKTFQSNLFVLPAGPRPPNPVALLNSSKFVQTLDVLRKRFQFVILDSPPLLSIADAHLIAAKVDGVILVVKAGETPKEIVKKALLHLARVGACVLGGTVNQVDLDHPEYSFYNRYYFDESYKVVDQDDESSKET